MLQHSRLVVNLQYIVCDIYAVNPLPYYFKDSVQKLPYLLCISNGDTALLHLALDLMISDSYQTVGWAYIVIKNIFSYFRRQVLYVFFLYAEFF